MSLKTVVIIGVGLIGGSIAAAAKRAEPRLRLLGVSPAPEHEQIRAAELDLELFAEWEDALAALPSSAPTGDMLIVLATPPNVTLALLPHIAARTEAILTDVCSVKQPLVDLADRLASPGRFVPAHPLAGSHEQGAAHACADLFVDRPVVLTPTVHSDSVAVQVVADFWRSLGGQVKMMSAAEHDRAVARSSHAVHALATVAARTIENDEVAEALASTGYGDTTRVAAGAAGMWMEILSLNAAEVLPVLDEAAARLDDLRAALRTGDADALRDVLTRAQQIREAWERARTTSSGDLGRKGLRD